MSTPVQNMATLATYVPSNDTDIPHLLLDLSGDRWVLTQVRSGAEDAFYVLVPLAGNTLWTPQSLSTIDMNYGPLGRMRFGHLTDQGMSDRGRNCWRCQSLGFDNVSCVVCLACQGAHRLTGCPDCDAAERAREATTTVITTSPADPVSRD